MNARPQLLAAARQIFETEGLEALSLRAVGRLAGLSNMAIYRHFKNKDELLRALMEDGFQAWEAMARAVKAEDPIVWLRALMAQFARFFIEDPHRAEAAFLRPAPGARTFPDDMSKGQSVVINMIIERIDAAKAAKAMIDLPSIDIALCLSATAQGVVSMYRARRFSSEADFLQSFAMITERCLASFLTKTQSQPSPKKD